MSYFNLITKSHFEILVAGGNITLEDLKHYSSLVKKPVSVELGGGQLYAAGGIKTYAPPPPSSGIVTTYILNILEGKCQG